MKALLAGVTAVVLAASSLYTLDAREVAVVTSFGAPVETVTEPGLKLRAPWPLHQVVRFDSRARLLQVPGTEVLTADKKNLVVEAYAIWKVADPQTFLEAVGSAEVAEARLSDLVVSRLASTLGETAYEDLLRVTPEVGDLLPGAALQGVAVVARERLGIDVLDLRIGHLGLPLQNEQSIYERMRAERLRIANQYRSEGEEQATRIRATADRQAAEILAAAERDASGITARAEGAAARVYASAYRQHPDFYGFLSELEASTSVLDEDAVLVLSPDDPLLGALRDGP